jgi:uncharacterized protein (DUF2267 family)
MKRLFVPVLGLAAIGVHAIVRAVRQHPRPRDVEHRLERRVGGVAADLSQRLQGASYRALGRRPDPNVTDAVLTQRIRSEIGPLLKRLDVPRIHVSSVDHVVRLHGRVPSASDRDAIERAVATVSGVESTVSYLHIGLGRGDTRPSTGHQHAPASAAFKELMGAGRELDIGGDDDVERMVRAVLATFVELLPHGERDHVLQHLPADVQGLLTPPRRIGLPPKPRTVDAFMDAIADACGRTRGTVEPATRSVLATLRELVPEETRDIAAVLPGELKELWARPTLVT